MKIWSQARTLAAQTPPERNRYVDLLRAVSILFVIVGHWLIATAYYADGSLTPGHLLKSHPQTQWLTWLFQVMPIFFIVGGYSNAVSLESAERKGVGYAGWLAARLNRLVAPLLSLLAVWAVIALIMHLMDVRPAVIQFTSRAALIPTWFLAIYIMLVILAPLAYRFWRHFGFVSLAAFAVLAAVTDVAFFAADMQWLGWSNYFWVWLAVHQLGFVWRDGRTGGPGVLLGVAAGSFALLYVLVSTGPYPLAMVGSPDEGLSNSMPPKFTLLVLGLMQFGLLLALQGPIRKALNGLNLWAGTVLINSMIMTVYLWHITVMVVLGSLLYTTGGFGLGIEPGSAEWWYTRPVWVAVLFVLLLPVALIMSPLERRSRNERSAIPSAARQIVGAVMICLGVSLLAMYGLGGQGMTKLTIGSIVMVFVGAGINGLLPVPGREPRT